MLYTILGAIAGGTITYVACKLTNTDCSSGGYAPSIGGYFIMMGTILGAGIGFGIGITRFMNGNYLG